MQTDFVLELRIAERPGSFSALLPDFFVIPKATSVEFKSFGGLLKKLVSVGFAPGHPASI